ncbi:MAG: glycosyltransferase family 4 protein [Thermodesulfobacteriota bacterium]
MRIGLVIYGDLNIVTGGFIYDRRVVEFLRNQGDSVEAFSLPWQTYGRCLFHNLSRDFLRTLTAAPLDVLLQDELNHPSLFWLNQRLRDQTRFPIVSVVHHLRSKEMRPAWQSRLYRWVERKYLLTCDGFIFNGETTRGTVEELIGPCQSFVVAPPAPNITGPQLTEEEVRQRSFLPGPLRVIFVGSLIPRKELHTLIRGLASVPHDLWHLEVVGSPDYDRPYADRIERLIAEEQVSDNVTMRGQLGTEELAQLLLESHVLAVPSSYEGFGFVYLEGMGFGLPAIGSTDGAAHETITHGRNGFLVAPGRHDQVATHVLDLSQDRERLVQMSLAALERYGQASTWEQTGTAIREFLLELVH